MSQSSKKPLVSNGLRYVTDDRPGITRRRRGKGFQYFNVDSSPVRDEKILARIRGIVIPPAWSSVWICPSPYGHIQATGRDARGRKQYRYHPDWRSTRDEKKFDRLAGFANALPEIRRQVAHDLRRHGLPLPKVLATIVRLLDLTWMRIGNETYARENDSFGITTLRNRHVKIEGSTLRFRFAGKSGKEHHFDLTDPQMARIVRRSRDLPGQTLFQYVDDDGQLTSVDSGDVNDYLRSIAGDDFTAKDFRTWAGTVLAVSALSAFDAPRSTAEANKAIVQAVDETAKCLGNTRAVCRSSYIHPDVLDSFTSGELADLSARSHRWKSDPWLEREELIVKRLLNREHI